MLPLCGKIIEKIIFYQVYAFLNISDLISVHAIYTAVEILQTLISHINDRLLAISDDGDGGVKLIEKFWTTVANFYIDPESSFVHFKAIPETTSPHPFQAAFLENIKEGVLPHISKGCGIAENSPV